MLGSKLHFQSQLHPFHPQPSPYPGQQPHDNRRLCHSLHLPSLHLRSNPPSPATALILVTRLHCGGRCFSLTPWSLCDSRSGAVVPPWGEIAHKCTLLRKRKALLSCMDKLFTWLVPCLIPEPLFKGHLFLEAFPDCLSEIHTHTYTHT